MLRHALCAGLVASLLGLCAKPADALTVRFTISSEMQYFGTSYGTAGGWFEFDTKTKTVTSAEMTSSWDDPAVPGRKVMFDQSHSGILEPVAGGIIITFSRFAGPGPLDIVSLSTRFSKPVVDDNTYGELLFFTDSQGKSGTREPVDYDLVALKAELVDPPTGVPLPAGVWFMVAGISGLGLLRRRSRPC